MFKRIAIVFLCAATMGPFLAADEQEATVEKLRELKKQRAAAATAARVTQSRAYYANLFLVRKELDPEDTVERFVLLPPGGPLVVEVSMTIDEKPFRLAREKLVDAMFEGSDKNDDGKLEWRTALASPSFAMGRVFGNLDGAPLQNMLNVFDLDKDGVVSRYEARVFLSRHFQGGPFLVSAVAGYGGRQLILRANGGYSGGAIAADVGKLLDASGDGVLSKEEIDEAGKRLKSRDANDDDLLYAREISGPATRATYRGQAQPFVQMALLLGPIASADSLYNSMKAAYKNEKDEIVGFSNNPELFKQLDKDSDGVLGKDEVLGLNDVEPYVSLKLDVGDAQKGKGLSVVKAPEGVEQRETNSSVSFELPGVGLSFTANKAKSRAFNYAPTATSYITRFDKDKNGYLEKKELMANLSRQFGNWDADQDGKVYAKEIEASYARMRAPMKSQIRAIATRQGNAIFDKLDVSGDRRLSLREMRNAHEGVRTFDANKDGQVTADEIPTKFVVAFALSGAGYGRPVVRRAGAGGVAASNAPKSDAPDWFNRMDRNRDGDVTLKEFLGGKEEFKKLDANNDGFIEPKEAKALGDAKAEEKK